MVDIGIGRLAELTGVKIPTIRFYEQNDLVPPPGRTKVGSAVMMIARCVGCTSSAMPAILALPWKTSDSF